MGGHVEPAAEEHQAGVSHEERRHGQRNRESQRQQETGDGAGEREPGQELDPQPVWKSPPLERPLRQLVEQARHTDDRRQEHAGAEQAQPGLEPGQEHQDSQHQGRRQDPGEASGQRQPGAGPVNRCAQCVCRSRQ